MMNSKKKSPKPGVATNIDYSDEVVRIGDKLYNKQALCDAIDKGKKELSKRYGQDVTFIGEPTRSEMTLTGVIAHNGMNKNYRSYECADIQEVN